jgi:hypothetical protein
MLPFWTFWIASAVGVLTIVSIGFGVVAAMYGVLQYNLALKQYQFSVAQACLDANVSEKLSQFCS